MSLHGPRLEPARDYIPRPLPLPRALRQPPPPRPAREVQGVRARPRLVARAPGDADARLPARLQRDAEDPDGRLRPLLALPARGAAGVGLLRHLAPVGVAQPPRECESDPQGALPAAARAALDGGDAARRLRRDARNRDRAEPRLRARGARHGLAGAAARS